jgi:hypothetical protein
MKQKINPRESFNKNNDDEYKKDIKLLKDESNEKEERLNEGLGGAFDDIHEQQKSQNDFNSKIFNMGQVLNRRIDELIPKDIAEEPKIEELDISSSLFDLNPKKEESDPLTSSVASSSSIDLSRGQVEPINNMDVERVSSSSIQPEENSRISFSLPVVNEKAKKITDMLNNVVKNNEKEIINKKPKKSNREKINEAPADEEYMKEKENMKSFLSEPLLNFDEFRESIQNNPKFDGMDIKQKNSIAHYAKSLTSKEREEYLKKKEINNADKKNEYDYLLAKQKRKEQSKIKK